MPLNLLNVSWKVKLNIKPSAANDRYVVNGFDISNAFYQFQCYVKTMIDEDGSFCLEYHAQHILALSSIFLVKPLQFHEDVKPPG
ncbi:hypothetical protein RO3G_07282 [Rhizopus delemar RA 99-880]|uniref:Uncharacterized protein n=1 Tax=Rhizopus delemar (strain RA 99-880 / ATCC MYA-4621 / FGSC 9543 / NRRL 43880) TaxID=246409 RepID=I1C297_RHIO9|nr:hypothetical protein RO3G_07282 [Rhizopus delemar RA 99-880]|eukprot:EIE82577.1 hypothetical protein RO3G_07282 [Rhizopus delemar RA 99-880]